MDIFPTQDQNASANLIAEQTKKLLQIRQQAYENRQRLIQGMGEQIGQGLGQGAEQGIQDHHVKAFLDQAYKQGRLAKGPDGQQMSPEAAFQQYKAGMGSQGMMAPTPNPVQASQVNKNNAEAALAGARKDALEHPAPKPPKGPNQLALDKFVADQSKELDNRMNPVNAPRGRLLGLLGTNNLKQLRASVTLNDPKMISQQLDNVSADIASVFQSGSPTEVAMAHNRFDNILVRIANLKSMLGTPAAINAPDVQNKLKAIVKDLSKTSNQILKDNINTEMRRTKVTQDKYPDFKKAAESLKKDLLDSYLLSEDGKDPGPKASSKVGRFTIEEVH